MLKGHCFQASEENRASSVAGANALPVEACMSEGKIVHHGFFESRLRDVGLLLWRLGDIEDTSPNHGLRVVVRRQPLR